MNRLLLLVPLALLGCSDPGGVDLQVGYRDGVTSDGQNGERGNVQISEVLWSGSVMETDSGPVHDPSDIFIELRNTGSMPLNVSGWYLEIRGDVRKTFIIPPTDVVMQVADEIYIAAKTDGCFPEPDIVVEGLELPLNAPFSITLRDVDERLINGAGDWSMPPFAGGYDLVTSRSMEMANIMFGARGNYPHSWHHWTNEPPADWNEDR